MSVSWSIFQEPGGGIALWQGDFQSEIFENQLIVCISD
jgi:hypothetical protein